MADIYSVLGEIYKGVAATVKECGFAAVIPEGTEPDAVPAVNDSGRVILFKDSHHSNAWSPICVTELGRVIPCKDLQSIKA